MAISWSTVQNEIVQQRCAQKKNPSNGLAFNQEFSSMQKHVRVNDPYFTVFVDQQIKILSFFLTI